MTERKLFSDTQPEDELLPSEIAALEAEVNKEVEKEIKAKAKEALREKLRTKARQARGVEEPMEQVTIDLADYADRITLDNVVFMHDRTYTVRASVAATLRDVMQRTWGHKSVTEGKSENFYRKSRAPRVIPVGENGVGVVNSSQLLKA